MTAVRLATIATLMLTSCAGCAVTRSPAASVRATPSPAHEQDQSTRIYAHAPADVRVPATHFAKAITEYDTRFERRRQFLGTLRRDATPAELGRLQRAPRSRLDWSVLRTRAEHTRLRITGVSDLRESESTDLVVVEGILSTATHFATVAQFVEFRVTLTMTRAGWRVARADGPGL